MSSRVSSTSSSSSGRRGSSGRTSSTPGGSSDILIPLRAPKNRHHGFARIRHRQSGRRRCPLGLRCVGIRQRRKLLTHWGLLPTRGVRWRRSQSLCAPNLARRRTRRFRSLAVVLAGGLGAAAAVSAPTEAVAADSSAASSAASDIRASVRHCQGQHRRREGFAPIKPAHMPPIFVIESRKDGVRSLLDYITQGFVPIPISVQPKHGQGQMSYVASVCSGRGREKAGAGDGGVEDELSEWLSGGLTRVLNDSLKYNLPGTRRIRDSRGS